MSAKVKTYKQIGPIDQLAAWDTIEESTKNTPDWHDLKKSHRDEFLVFVTGNNRVDYWRNYELRGCNYYGVGVTWADNFIMKRSSVYTKKGAVDPMVFEFPTKTTNWNAINHVFTEDMTKKVEGDVYGVPLRRLAFIDNQEGNTDGMNRVERWVDLKHPMQDEKCVRCFMYVVDTEFFIEYFSYSTELANCNTIGYTNGITGELTDAYYAPKTSRY